jgi:hypothetical protein
VHARELEQAARDLRRLHEHAAETGALFVVTAAAAAIALPAVPSLAAALLVGAGVEAMLLAVALHRYRERLGLLALDPSAYVLPEVERYGRRLTEPRQRARLAAWILEILAEAHLPGNLFLGDRAARCAHELEGIARDLLRPGASVRPASAAACRRLLTHSVGRRGL